MADNGFRGIDDLQELDPLGPARLARHARQAGFAEEQGVFDAERVRLCQCDTVFAHLFGMLVRSRRISMSVISTMSSDSRSTSDTIMRV